MIRSFASKATESIWHGQRVAKLSLDVQRVGRRKLRMLNNASELHELRVPPKNKLEKLKGDRAGQFSIRINDQWRVCFAWKSGDAFDVEITDYH
ncbi:MAG: type II toxin-antitoxin system RelE/ParE family toxin [Spirochaetales bacterium]